MHLHFNNCESMFQLGQENESSNDNTRTPYSYYEYDNDTGIYTLSVEMPGISKDMLEIMATDHTITIRTKNDENNHVNKQRYYREFNFRTKIDPNNINAAFSDGLLGLKVKKDVPQSVEIKIN